MNLTTNRNERKNAAEKKKKKKKKPEDIILDWLSGREFFLFRLVFLVLNCSVTQIIRKEERK